MNAPSALRAGSTAHDTAAADVANSDAVDEPALVARIRDGDERAFEALYRVHYQALSRFAASTTGSSVTAEELVQDVFLAIWRRRDQWEPAHGVAAYLYGAVRNRALNVLRQADAAARFGAFAAREMRSMPVPALHVMRPGPDEMLAVAELTRAVSGAVVALKERERTGLRLRWIEQLTHAEIGAVLGLTEEGARLLVHRAERSVRTAVEELRA